MPEVSNARNFDEKLVMAWRAIMVDMCKNDI